MARTLSVLLSALLLIPPQALANPLGGQVVGGSGNIQGQGSSNVTVNQTSDRAIFNWNTFNIGAGERTQFIQPNSGSIALNRVTGNLGPSQIFGTIQANGRVFLVNPDGILFGAGAQVNTAGFLATTSDIKNSDFMAGRMNFSIPGRPDASIVNYGNITAESAGFAALVAPGVRNAGVITANWGRVALASGNTFALDFYGDKLIQLQVGDTISAQVRDVATGRPLKSLVKNTGTLQADAGTVQLSASAARAVVNSVINNRGVIQANSIGTHNGRIVLGAATTHVAGGPTQRVKIAGTLSAKGSNAGERGGKIKIDGEAIELKGAKIDATGDSGGGRVLIGGRGNLPGFARTGTKDWPSATTVTADATTVIDASAITKGNGGQVVVWSNGLTSFAGLIKATGGAQSGNGGFVETSGHTLAFTGARVDTSAPNGRTGQWLLDPDDLIIRAGEAATISTNLATTDVKLQTTGAFSESSGQGDIIVATDGAISWSSAHSLTLSAYHDVNINANITSTGGGGVTLRADNTGLGSGTVTFRPGGIETPPARISTSGNVAIFYNPNSEGGYNGSDRSDNSGNPYTINMAGGAHLTAYMLVNTVSDLQNVQTHLSGHYALGRDIDAHSISNFNPIGFGPGCNSGCSFTGLFDGQNQTISNLTIAPTAPGLNTVGLFAINDGTIRNLNLTNVSVTANPNGNSAGQFVGTLAGWNRGSIDNVTVDGRVNGGRVVGVIAGGLVGQNGVLGQSTQTAEISNSHAAVTVTAGNGGSCDGNTCNGGFNSAGGLVGFNVATIRDSSASGDVTVGANSNAGGLVGTNQNAIFNFGDNQSLSGPQIIDSFATGNVFSNGINVSLGGLVGFNGARAVIDTSFATGNVTSTATIHNFNSSNCSISNSCQWANVGGLVGQNQGTIMFSVAGGDVSVGSGGTGGGLVGQNDGHILVSVATGNVTGAAGSGNDNFDNQTTLGGLVGENSGLIEFSAAFGNVGTPGVSFLRVGGFAGGNNGTITSSFAFGNVSAGDHSQAGGFVADNNVPDNNTCTGGCVRGDGFNGNARIDNSFAVGDVTVGAFSLAGGFAATSGDFDKGTGTTPAITNSFSSGNVTAAGNSIIGGFIGVSDLGSVISNSASFGSVTSTGPNTIAGGFVGLNGGFINESLSASPVTGTSNSFLGGFAGLNLGIVIDSTATADASVTGAGGSNYAGGFVGVNFGFIDPSTAAGTVTSGPNSVVGAFAGANATFTNLQLSGTISSDSTASGPGPFIGTPNSPTTLPSYPSILANCDATLCQILNTGQLPQGNGSANPNPTPQVSPPPPQQQISSIFTDQNNQPTQINLTQPDSGSGQGGSGQGGGGQGGGQGGGSGNTVPPPTPGGPPPGAGIGRTLSEQQISGVPPIGETRFLPEIVLQISNTVPAAQIQQVAQQFGLTLLATQTFNAAGRVVYRFDTNGKDVRQVIRTLEQNRIVASVEPNYVFRFAQAAVPAPEDRTGSLPPPELQSDLANADVAARSGPLPVGDAAQYIIGKLKLSTIHQRVRGRNVPIAVIDSEVDPQHPDLAGVIAERFDATGTASSPHAHGTGMAGAIASHQRLLGIAPGVRILAVKAFDETAASAEATSFQILKALDYAMSKNVRIINMSFAGPRDPMMERVLKTAYDKGIILIAAAGNAGPKSPPLYPGADPSVIAVTATDYADKPFAMANRGKYIAVAAPGVDVLVPAPSSGYQLTTGTSVAAAHVSGVAALLIETKPTITPAEVRAILTRTSHAITLRAKDDPTGAGLVDPVQALQSLAPPRSAEAARERTEEFGSAIASPAARRRAARHARCVVSLRGGARPNRSWRPMSTVV